MVTLRHFVTIANSFKDSLLLIVGWEDSYNVDRAQPRRYFLVCLVTIFLLLPLSAEATETLDGIPSSGTILFDVFMEGDKVGQDRITFNRNGDTLVVERTVNLSYSFAYVNFLDYTHKSRDYWKHGRLVKVEGRTNNNGEKLTVRARRDGEEMVIIEGEKPGRTPSRVIPTSWWNHGITKGPSLLDTQYGRYRSVSVEKVGEASRRKGSETVTADHYRVSGDLELQLWYGPDEELVGIEFERKGYTFTYERIK